LSAQPATRAEWPIFAWVASLRGLEVDRHCFDFWKPSLSLVLTFALPLILSVTTGRGKNSAALGGPEFRISLALSS
jgi:hypothetical protein